ncbi:RNA polymerase sigma factor [Kitasatospora sp. NPDC057198]|uniref:RNA polymerase sigma factor n=1 Tax=Kitasatospora sp. NPDC057198 TaxID=3346046 RepID=UPI003627F944
MGAAEDFSALYREHHGAVLRYLHRRVGADSAGDLAAEVFTVVWRRWAEVPGEALPWLYGVARNVVANHVRGRERAGRLAAGLAADAAGPGRDVAEQVAARDGVHAAWSRLAERDREVLALTGWEGLDTRQAARALGCSPAAFSVRLYRARRRLRAVLDEQAAAETVAGAAETVVSTAVTSILEVGRARG